MPMAVHAPAAKKTFFVWGGAGERNGGNLGIMISYYDHATGLVPRPVVVRDCGSMNDAHANPSLTIDEAGHLWVFAAQRHGFPGKVYRSAKPFDIAAFAEVGECNAYPQPWSLPGNGLFLLETHYSGGRETYWRTSVDGQQWADQQKLLQGGHYIVSHQQDGRILVAADWHNKSSDFRTNVYLLQTTDGGRTWTTVDGQPLPVPLKFPANPALVKDEHGRGRFVFLNDLKLDRQGQPLILYISRGSGAYAPGPGGAPREWTLARWTGKEWLFNVIAQVDHNYDYGNLHVEPDGTLVVVGPTGAGPQPDWTGGEVALWVSKDNGATWKREHELTAQSQHNHSYVRIPVNAHPDFFALWADGNAAQRSESHLYFATRDGRTYRLPFTMEGDTAPPTLEKKGFTP
jgi:hypothetical protein